MFLSLLERRKRSLDLPWLLRWCYFTRVVTVHIGFNSFPVLAIWSISQCRKLSLPSLSNYHWQITCYFLSALRKGNKSNLASLGAIVLFVWGGGGGGGHIGLYMCAFILAWIFVTALTSVPIARHISLAPMSNTNCKNCGNIHSKIQPNSEAVENNFFLKRYGTQLLI